MEKVNRFVKKLPSAEVKIKQQEGPGEVAADLKKLYLTVTKESDPTPKGIYILVYNNAPKAVYGEI